MRSLVIACRLSVKICLPCSIILFGLFGSAVSAKLVPEGLDFSAHSLKFRGSFYSEKTLQSDSQVTSNTVIHRVSRGDNLSRLASRYGTTVEAIQLLNGMGGRSLLRIGQRLEIPSEGSSNSQIPGQATSIEPGGAIVHRVNRGDNLSRLAQRYGTTVRSIQSANGLGSRTLLRIGQRLEIPGGRQPSSQAVNAVGNATGGGTIVHRVSRGDNLSRLARRYGSSVRVIQSSNGLGSRTLIRVGQYLTIPTDGKWVPKVRAEAAIIYDPIKGEVIWEDNSNASRSIASITKVMTAVVFLESLPDLEETVQVERADVRRASTTYLRNREELKVGDLLHLALVASDNAAARVLARISIWGSEGFVQRMNEKASALGLSGTTFADPSGLDAQNVSSALDVSRLIVYASGNEQISKIMQKRYYRVQTNRRSVRVRNTNRLLADDLDILGGKTGFIRKAGYCLATLINLPNVGPVAVVVLGAWSNSDRFNETHLLANWASTQFAE